ncbi:tRNA-guanine family transglycosylase [Methanobrevibacter gottschalkii]|uniref:tRNA-guanine family transglycosylase n=2 Tax=Methanobrevibacter gottschalkii TaxID=190974 RepID=A0A3N5B7X8_9EURY|nr:MULTISPECIES: archaeosine tRNA-ribosyltransferase [Methanobrevibacter]MCQ2970693.1 archaeosine tRNA-ribosyltransferase [archaeon]OEC97095.1 archaeosine tRNA-ribosyltransferase [Methanobrevibacter sp. A27]RPF51590.1 tRNA-guanine family transglycosylase [Methanobrevibacter gottschalkii DSM 11977]SEL24301.1 tRNA-guanine family transglycosylase [Methanobrevibacter gottschalkii]
MIKKFEIKSHDGPGRIGKVDGELTPRIFFKEELKIAPNQGSAHNIDREIAEFNVKETLKLAKENAETCNIAVIQGSKYIDLRIECLKKLEEIGYNGFIIANGDALLTNSRELVDIIISLKKEAKKTSYFIFPFAELSFMPLLTYMGIDGFLADSANYYSYMNVLQTPTKSYDLNNYPIYENISQKDLEKKNLENMKFVIKEIHVHMKNKSLRNLVEERSGTTPQNISTLKILDKNHMNYLLEYTQIF